MKLFLIRHGRSNAHEQNRRQTPFSSLSAEGLRQANAVSIRMAKEEINVILSSPWKRAKQTAEVISKNLNIPLELFDGIKEKELHPSLYGTPMTSKVQAKYEKEIEKVGDDLDWKFGGEGESLRDTIKRSAAFLRHLIHNHSNDNVLAVTHGLFIRSAVILAILGEKFDEKSFAKLFRSITVSNTSVTLLEYDKSRNHWELRYFNDHLHIK